MARLQTKILGLNGLSTVSDDKEIRDDLATEPQSDTECQVPAPGIAHVLSRSWPPNLVQPKKRKQATIFFILLIILYVAFAVASVIYHYRQRFNPPVTFRRDEEKATFIPPIFTFCTSSNDHISLSCNIDNNNGEECTVANTEFEDGGYFCTIGEISGEIYPDKLKTIYVSGDTGYQVHYFASSSKITNYAELSLNEQGYFLFEAAYQFEVTKQTTKQLLATAGGFRIEYSESTSYNINGHYIGNWDVGTSALYLFSNALGTDILEDNDPVNVLSLIGSIAGLLGYVMLVFSLVFGKSIYFNMKEFDDEHSKFFTQRVWQEKTC